MSNYNPIIRGFNAVSKFVTRGFGQVPQSGDKVPFCRTWTAPYICQKLSTLDYIEMKVSTQ